VKEISNWLECSPIRMGLSFGVLCLYFTTHVVAEVDYYQANFVGLQEMLQ